MIVGDITIEINKSNKKHFLNKGYDITDGFIIIKDFNDINKGSHAKIQCECDFCHCIKYMEFRTYYKLTKSLNDYYHCKKCSIIKNKETNLLKYGVDHPMKNNDVIQKLIKTNNDRYGCNSSSMLATYKEKKKQTNLEKYNKTCPLLNDDIKLKTKKTNLSKYGYEHHNKNIDIKEKIKLTKKYKYGDEKYNNIDKIKETNLLKYGYYNPMKNQDVINKSNITKTKSLINKYPNIISVDYSKHNIIMKCDNNKDHIFEISTCVFQNRKKLNTTLCTICNNGISSGLEIELLNFIRNVYDGIIIENDRKVIGKELDIYLPDLNLAFEFNGLYWHNELNKPSNYHNDKTDLCYNKGINLIHIWEDDWIYKKEIVKSMILNKLNKSINKLYARKCSIVEITDNKIVKSFLDTNHIQGFVGSHVKIGLYYDGELVSLMTFGKPRTSMNMKTNNNNEYELLRFCNKINTNVIGGASKLFKYFLYNYLPVKIITFADRCYSNGDLYFKLGFCLNYITEPNYYYIIDNIRKNRFGFRKDILVKQGYDDNKSEHEIMLERKIYRIYNSGNYRFTYIK